MNKFDRITATLIHLQSKRIVKAKDIAKRFNVSLRTVYRDIRTLEQAGVPILSEPGIGYSIMSGYKLPPIMFTENEATSFLIAEKLIESIMDGSTVDYFKSAMYKVRSVLNSSEKESLQNLDQHLEVSPNQSNINSKLSNNILQTIFKSVVNKNVLQIQYKALHSEQETERQVEPIGAIYYSNNWHLIAYCRLRNDYRDFRVDRITKILMTEVTFNPNHPTLKEYLKQISKEQELKKVVVLIKKSSVHFIRNQKFFYGYVQEKEKGKYIEMTFLTSSLKGFAHWILFLTDNVIVNSPKALKDEMKILAAKLKKHYR